MVGPASPPQGWHRVKGISLRCLQCARPSALHTLSDLILLTTPKVGYHYPHFSAGESEVQTGECPRPLAGAGQSRGWNTASSGCEGHVLDPGTSGSCPSTAGHGAGGASRGTLSVQLWAPLLGPPLEPLPQPLTARRLFPWPLLHSEMTKGPGWDARSNHRLTDVSTCGSGV